MQEYYNVVIFSSSQTFQADEICMAIDQTQRLRSVFGNEFLSYGLKGESYLVNF